MNSASPGDYAPEPHLLALGTAAEAEHLAEPGPAAAANSQAEQGPARAAELQLDTVTWRREVATRLAHYRTRRKPRAPRYPSLLLPFDAHNSTRPFAHPDSELHRKKGSNEVALGEGGFSDTAAAGMTLASTIFENSVAEEADLCERESAAQDSRSDNWQGFSPLRLAAFPPEPSAKILEFPRSAAIPLVQTTPLADPIFDRPRIVEAPEIVPPAPAMGGILIESVQPELPDKAPRAEAVIPAASVARRLLAAALDAMILGMALAGFAAIFWRFNPPVHVSPLRAVLTPLASLGGALTIVLWMTYQFLLIVVTGSTPGLRAARLRLANFDGSPVIRRTRRWRVLASFLSAFSAGLGYLWCFVDQDSLCWHDRITRTHIERMPSPQ
ncbi:MAG: RDD family protein [Terriglobales bacterium]